MKLLVKLAAASAVAVSFSASAGSIYFFGDSLSDTGNTSFYSANIATPPVARPSVSPGSPYAPGQFTDNTGGGVWSQQFAKLLGQPNEARFSIAGGHNYAWAGALTYTTPQTLPGLDQQILAYLGANPGNAAADDLYVIMIGGNNILPAVTAAGNAAGAAAAAGGNAQAVNAAFGAVVASEVNRGLTDIANAVLSLNKNRNATHFLIANMPDVGGTPDVIAQGNAAVAGVDIVVNAWNGAFAPSVRNLGLGLGVDIDVLDLYGLATADPKTYFAQGFTNLTDTCFATATLPLQDCRTYFFSDGFHPTAAAHNVIARTAINALPVPGSLALVLLGVFGFFGFRHKKA
jgi:outer membrane lipase/esterase